MPTASRTWPPAPMADDMRLAALVINRLVEEIGNAAATVNEAIARLIEQATGQ
jgi:hypothetical protein